MDTVVIVPLYPQYSVSTSGSSLKVSNIFVLLYLRLVSGGRDNTATRSVTPHYVQSILALKYFTRYSTAQYECVCCDISASM